MVNVLDIPYMDPMGQEVKHTQGSILGYKRQNKDLGPSGSILPF